MNLEGFCACGPTESRPTRRKKHVSNAVRGKRFSALSDVEGGTAGSRAQTEGMKTTTMTKMVTTTATKRNKGSVMRASVLWIVACVVPGWAHQVVSCGQSACSFSNAGVSSTGEPLPMSFLARSYSPLDPPLRSEASKGVVSTHLHLFRFCSSSHLKEAINLCLNKTRRRTAPESGCPAEVLVRSYLSSGRRRFLPNLPASKFAI